MTHWSEEIRAAAHGQHKNLVGCNVIVTDEILFVLLGIEQNHIGQPACEPGGLVSAAWVERERQADSLRAEQVARAYPQLAPKRDPVDTAGIRRALFGDDDT